MLGLTACTTSYPSPSRSMAAVAKFSTMTSARFAMFLTRSSPPSDLRLTVMDFLLALNNRKYQESRFSLAPGPGCRPSRLRPASPPCGFSTLTTSAPSQASASVQDGPASNWVRSRTRTPARQPGSAPLVAIFSFLPLGADWLDMIEHEEVRHDNDTAVAAVARMSQRVRAKRGPMTISGSALQHKLVCTQCTGDSVWRKRRGFQPRRFSRRPHLLSSALLPVWSTRVTPGSSC